MIGTTLGRYRIVAKLGEGGMGSVWRAEDPALERTVALKLLSPALWASDAARQRFLREARAASKLDHPNIATVYDVGETDGVAWIAYQFIDGETVAARTARGPLPLAEAIALAIDVAQALAHAHEHGVLHRDVTAGNVMVTPHGRAVLVDFGLARPEGGTQLTSTGTMLGTAGYLAPEVLRGQPAGERSDLYGLGAVLYRMLTGRLPFEGEVPEALLYRMLNEPVPPPSEFRSDIPQALERVVMRLLEREQADRYTSAPELSEALKAAAAAQGPTKAEARRRIIARRWREITQRLRRVGSARIGVAALASIVVLGGAMWFAARYGWLSWVVKRPPTIAVLPFKNLTSDPETSAYLADGVVGALATDLAQSERLRVLPWATTQRVEPSDRPLEEIARDLHADKLLVGTLGSAPTGVEVTLSLVDGRNGSQTWSRPFEGAVDALPALESRMLFETAGQLLGTLTPAERASMQLPSGRDGRAYNLYLKGSALLSETDPVALETAAQLFTRALAMDPTSAEAQTGLGAVFNARYFQGLPGGSANFDSARAHFEAAADLDPGSPLVMRAAANLEWQRGRGISCLEIGQRALHARPRTLDLLVAAAEAYTLGGLPDVGLKLSERVLETDPSNAAARYWAVTAASWSGRGELALRHAGEYIRRFGETGEIYIWMTNAALGLRQGRKAVEFGRRARDIEGDSGDPRGLMWSAIAEQLVLGADSASTTWRHMRELLRARLAVDPDQLRNRFHLMLALVALGERAEALREWEVIRPHFGSSGTDGLPLGYVVGPCMMVALGKPDEASRLIDLWDKGGLGWSPWIPAPGDYPVNQVLGGNRGPILERYLALQRKRAREAAVRYQPPTLE